MISLNIELCLQCIKTMPRLSSKLRHYAGCGNEGKDNRHHEEREGGTMITKKILAREL